MNIFTYVYNIFSHSFCYLLFHTLSKKCCINSFLLYKNGVTKLFNCVYVHIECPNNRGNGEGIIFRKNVIKIQE